MSVVAIDPEDRALSTISLHSFSSEFKRDGFSNHFQEPIVRVGFDLYFITLIFSGEFRILRLVFVSLWRSDTILQRRLYLGRSGE